MNSEDKKLVLLVIVMSILMTAFSMYFYFHFVAKSNYVSPNQIQNNNNEKPIEIPKLESKINTDYTFTSDGCPKPNKNYEDETYLDVDQKISLLDKNYTPDDLVKFDRDLSKYPDLCIKNEVAQALKSLMVDAEKDGHTIILSSGFRDYSTQASILSASIKSGNKNANLSIAKPGYSEHQLGVAVDLTSKSIAYESATGKFKDTPESLWLEEHAYEYGFIQSYPEGKEDITGYIYEPWHYRYLGIENAEEIQKTDETINQFLKRKIDEEKEKNNNME